jgi:hypothetical protein
MNETCRADSLSRAERDELARLLARWSDRAARARRKYYGRKNVIKRSYLTSLAAEMTDLWLDVSGQREPSKL